MKKLEDEIKQTEVLATFLHGNLFGLHTLGIVYNLKKRNYIDAAIHTVVGIYDLYATIKHYKDTK